MGIRPGSCYATLKDRPYTRKAHKKQKKDYIGAIPGVRTRQWNMGNGVKEFDTLLNLKTTGVPLGVQIRDNSIESARLAINRALVETIGKEDFFLKVRIFPHHILRENKQAQGAGADRVSKGMSHSFGKSIGRAARVKNGQTVFSVLVANEDKEKAKKALLKSISRFTCQVTVEESKDVESIGTKPKKTRDMLKAQKTEDGAETETTETKAVAGKKAEPAKKADAGKKAEPAKKPEAGKKK